MSHFYASIKGTKGEATRCGDKSRGINGHIRGWNFGVNVKMEYNADTGEDEAVVHLTGGTNGYKPWRLLNRYTIKNLTGRDKNEW